MLDSIGFFDLGAVNSAVNQGHAIAAREQIILQRGRVGAAEDDGHGSRSGVEGVGELEIEVTTDYAGRNAAHYSASLWGDGKELARFTALAQREAPEFLSTAALRGAGNSGRSYDYARFTVIGGYDHSSEGFGAAEVVQGVLKLHAKSGGVSYQ